MSFASVDMETFSMADLRAVGAWRYAEDPSTEILCMAWVIDDGEPRIWTPETAFPVELGNFIQAGGKLRAWNANFERAIWTRVMPRLFNGYPGAIKVEQWDCSQAVAAMCSIPLDLESAAIVVRSPLKKNPEGRTLLRRFAFPRKPTKSDDRDRIRPVDDPEGFAALCRYCVDDVKAERGIRARLPIPELPAGERKLWALDSRINERGIAIDQRLATGALRLIAGETARGNARLARITGGKVKTAGQAKALGAWLRTHAVDLPDMRASTVADALAAGLIQSPLARDALKIRASLAKASTAKFSRMLKAVCRDGRLRGMNHYHAAGTGRWGGRIVQLQNLPRPKAKIYDELDWIRDANGEWLAQLYPDIMDVCRDALRPALCAAPGHALVVADFNAIEARVLGWMASDPRYLKAFREGLDLYKVTAAVIFGVKYEDVTEDQRQVGKVAVLALGYGMGADKFEATCNDTFKLNVPRSIIDRAHLSYRRTYAPIVSYWRRIEGAAVACMQTRQRTVAGPVKFELIGSYLTMMLPSGRRLFYPGAALREVQTKWGMRTQLTYYGEIVGLGWARIATYGGKLTENADQAISRDMEAHAIVQAEDAGLPVVTHTHDELVCEVPEAEATPALAALQTIMSNPPPYAPSLPLKASGFASPYYKK